MKKRFFLSTRLCFFLTLIPIIGLFVLAVICHDRVDTVYKMFPLEIVTAAGAIFDVLYFFRGLSFSRLGIRDVGVFSPRDTAVFAEGNTLIFTIHPKRKVKVALFGDRGDAPDFDWLTDESDGQRDIFLFRGKMYATAGQLQGLLGFYGVNAEDASAALAGDHSAQCREYSLSSAQKNELRELRLTLKALPDIEES